MADSDTPTRRFIRDTHGRRFELTTLLGRGSFGKVYRAQHEGSDEVLAAKLPLSEEDLPGEAPTQELRSLYSRLLRDEAAQLRKLPPNRVPGIHGIVDGGGAVPCLLMTYYEDSLLERLRKGMTFAELCGAMARTCRALEVIHATGQTHGNLKPGNIFFFTDEDGQPQVRLTDPLTPLYLKSLDALAARDSSVAGWLPPEVLGPGTQLPLPRSADAFCIGKLVYEAIVHPENLTTSFSGRTGPFLGAIDKGRINKFRTALATRLHEGNSNPHVRELLIKRATSFLVRALSQEVDPSPPYRFYSMAEMANRLEELQGLFHPGFAQMGSLISGSSHADGAFYAGEEVRFTLSFRCHGGIDDVDLITCMTYVRDLVAEEKVRDAGVEVVPNHDGHRFRFTFRIPNLKPGHYLVRVALAIKGSPGKPVHRDLTFSVHEETAEDGSGAWPGSREGTEESGTDSRDSTYSMDVIPPDLLQDWRTEPTRRRFGRAVKAFTQVESSDRSESERASEKERKDTDRTDSGSAIVWSSERDERRGPSATADDLDDRPARLVVRPTSGSKELEAAEAEDRGEGGSSGRRGGKEGKRRDRDEVRERATGVSGGRSREGSSRKGRPRTSVGAAPVGRDAARHPEHAPAQARESRREPSTGKGFLSQAWERAFGAEARGSSTGSDEVKKGRTGAEERKRTSEPSSRRGDREGGGGSSDERRSGPPRDPAGSRRGYYDQARTLPSAQDDAFFKRGALKTQHQVILIGALSLGAVCIVALAIVLIFL